jgi:hypothetical protein
VRKQGASRNGRACGNIGDVTSCDVGHVRNSRSLSVRAKSAGIAHLSNA